ncbi:hypothetical protein RSAG8_10892, partial [Rhizoctonia solani AG-8 WAC10335]
MSRPYKRTRGTLKEALRKIINFRPTGPPVPGVHWIFVTETLCDMTKGYSGCSLHPHMYIRGLGLDPDAVIDSISQR